ncbi:uncharacterized protein J7T54_002609 [Emericellopsis cladophorae]|uniref:DUF6987 domain-containing protein n=1 Tax=Emericellopsis cladophorae TaxID=2686198 RepID=A0A9Q0BAJ6_9HYPO|nr:uncharacterized protein J7T54_002609 [Emericellopsis cladophorae]KAI6778967.1 hypothetical protein J7T54_002609 [Emericellopsis cladophorae]
MPTNPLSVPGGWKKDTPSAEKSNPNAAKEQADNVPRSVTGTVNESGEIVDESGKSIGKIADSSDPKELAGNTVNEAGNIVSEAGDVLGKATLGDDEAKAKDTTDKTQTSAEKAADDATDKVDDTTESAGEYTTEGGDSKSSSGWFGKTAKGAYNSLGSLGSKGKEATDDVQGNADNTTQDTQGQVDETTEKAQEGAEDPEKKFDNTTEDTQGQVDETTEKAQEGAEDPEKKLDNATEDAQDKVDEAEEGASQALDFSVLENATVNKGGNLVIDGKTVGKLVEGDVKKIQGCKSDEQGQIWNDSGKVVGKAEPLPQDDEPKEDAPFKNFPDAIVRSDGSVVQSEDNDTRVGTLVEGDAKKLKGSKVDEDGDVLDSQGNKVGKAESWDEPEEEPAAEEEAPDCSMLDGAVVNKAGNLTNQDGKVVGKLVEGDVKKLQGLKCDGQGQIWNDSGKVVGKAQPVGEDDQERMDAPFQNFPDAVVEGDGSVTSDGKRIGTVIDGDAKKLKGSKVDEDGDILDRNGNTVGKAEPWDEPEPEEAPEEEVPDWSFLDGCTVNKLGKLVNKQGEVVGTLKDGNAKELQGHRSDANGQIWNDSGKVVGQAEPVSDSERQAASKSYAPFENFPDAVVEADGSVTADGKRVGTLIDGDAKKLKGSKVDEDGDVLDRNGNTVGKAEPWDEPEAEEEPEADRSVLAGKRVNKAGNVVDGSGVIFGKVVEGNASSMVGRMCNKQGQILSESGDVLGQAEVVSEGEREGSKEGPFAELEGLTVAKDGTIVTPAGDIVGRLTSGDGNTLFGRSVDQDGEIVDKNGNTLGKAERWSPPEEEPEEKSKGPMEGLKVNREGNVVNNEGETIGKLVSGDLSSVIGKEIDADGDIINTKGQTVGHVALLEDIPQEEEPEPEETEEERKAREKTEAEEQKAENDRQLAGQLSGAIEQSLEKIQPILTMIKDKMAVVDNKKPEEIDQEQLVKEVRPLIEEGGKILQETNGIVRGMDPDGRIQRQAKQKSGTKEASPEEHHLAEVLKTLTGDVTQTVDGAKRKLESLPKAKKELNPLWGLLTEPLGQIIAAVGLLLTGVLGIVGRLLSGLGLGNLVDGLLGGLGM